MPSAWVEHIRKWAKDHDLSYMCAATEPAAREAYHKGILPEKKKAAKKMNKSLAELKDKYPSYAEMKSQRTEQQQMGGEDRNILKVPRPPSTMIGVASIELPEPPQEAKRVVVGKTIRVRKTGTTSSETRENQAMGAEDVNIKDYNVGEVVLVYDGRIRIPAKIRSIRDKTTTVQLDTFDEVDVNLSTIRYDFNQRFDGRKKVIRNDEYRLRPWENTFANMQRRDRLNKRDFYYAFRYIDMNA